MMYRTLVVRFFFSNFLFFPELGTRQHCRDNVTMSSDLKVVGFSSFTIFVVATPSTVDTETLIFFEFFLVPYRFYYVVALLRCRCREAKQLSRAQPRFFQTKVIVREICLYRNLVVKKGGKKEYKILIISPYLNHTYIFSPR